jgi:hypothetical protein
MGVGFSPLVPRRYIWFLALADNAVSLLGALVAMATGDPASSRDPGRSAVVLAATFLLVRSAARATSKLRASRWMTAAGAVSGALFILLNPMLGLRPGDSHDAVFGHFIFAGTFALMDGLAWELFARIVQPSEKATVERSDWAVIGVATWIAFPVATWWLVARDTVEGIELCACAALAALAAFRIVRRRLWLLRVAAGRVAAWRIDRSDELASDDLPVLVPGPLLNVPGDPEARIRGVLLRTEAAPDRPFRETRNEVAVARVGTPAQGRP